jgi:hypothetical protein
MANDYTVARFRHWTASDLLAGWRQRVMNPWGLLLIVFGALIAYSGFKGTTNILLASV